MEEEETGPAKHSMGGSLKKTAIVFIAALAVFVLGGYGALRAGLLDGYFAAEESGEAADKEQGDAVAMVNGQGILRANYEQRLAQETAQYQQQGIDVSTPENIEQIQNQVVQVMVNELLLLQGAQATNVAPTDEQITERYSLIAEQYGGVEALTKTLADQGIPQEQVRLDIGSQLAIEQYLSGQVDVSGVTATEEEVRAAYNEAIVGQSDVPPYEEVSQNIKEQVIQRKQDQLVSDFIVSLREKSVIKILL